MGRMAFVRPETVRIALSDGDWIEVKKHLPYAEQETLASAATPSAYQLGSGSTALTLDLAALGVKRMCTWIVDWSFVGLDGKAAKVTPENVSALQREVADEVNAALDEHIKSAGKEASDPNAKPAGATS